MVLSENLTTWLDWQSVERDCWKRVTRLRDRAACQLRDSSVGRHIHTPVSYAGDLDMGETVCLLLETQIARTPDRVAVVFEGREYSYEEVGREATHLARLLRYMGVKVGDRVGVLFNRSPEMLFSIVAVLKCGAAYVPLDPTYPKDRIKMVVEDADLALILTEPELRESLTWLDTKMVSVDSAVRNAVEVNGVGDSSDTALISGDDLAYVIFTSGSTGRPKGVEIRHSSVAHFLKSIAEVLQIDSHDRILATTSISFDISVLELFLPLVLGGTVVLASSPIASDPVGLSKLMNEQRVTVMQATPSAWHLLLEGGWKGHTKLKLLCGGEPMSPKLAKRLLHECGELWNLYGPTEATVWATAEKVRLDDVENNTISVGRPMGETKVFVLDERLNPVSPGEVGVVYLGGKGLARGYLNQPDLTRERFIPNPLDPAGGTLYNTGDIGKQLEDGRLVILGRSDTQVKVRGHRVELSEIEAILCEYPGVRQAVVVGSAGAPTTDRLKAYILSIGSDLYHEDAMNFLKQKLPKYMIPSELFRVDSLPLTPNGKIDRRALMNGSFGSRLPRRALVAPRNDIERGIFSIWSDLLGHAEFGVFDDFFEVGGDSLLSLQLVYRIERWSGKGISLEALVQNPTIAGLAKILRHPGDGGRTLVRFGSGRQHGIICLVHTRSGVLDSYVDLVRALEFEGEILGFQSPALTDGGIRLQTVEEMASHFIRYFSGDRNVALLGYSFGGLVALEMALELKPDLLILIDPDIPIGGSEESIDEAAFWYSEFGDEFISYEDVRRLRPSEQLEYLVESFSSGEKTPARFRSMSRKALRTHLEIQMTNYRASVLYKPRSYSGDVLMFTADGDKGREQQFDWGQILTGRVEYVSVKATHNTIMRRPVVWDLAAHISKRLRTLAKSLE